MKRDIRDYFCEDDAEDNTEVHISVFSWLFRILVLVAIFGVFYMQEMGN